MGEDRDRRECCERECRDKCVQECMCDNGGGWTNIIWILILLYLLSSCSGNGKGGFLGGLF